MDVDQLAWRTSSFSAEGDNGDSCVEVAPLPRGVAMRDTKDRTRAPRHYSRPAWAALVIAVHAGELEH